LEIHSYTRLGDVNFTDRYDAVRQKVSAFKNVHERVKQELNKSFPTIHVQDLELLIVFVESGETVRYFEIGSDVFHLNRNLHTEPLKRLRQVYKELDNGLLILEDGIDSQLFGVRITKPEDSDGNDVLVYNKDFTKEAEVSEDDIISFFLNN
jgi:hypothetical protein